MTNSWLAIAGRRSLVTTIPNAIADLAADDYWGKQWAQLRALEDLVEMRNGAMMRILDSLLDVEETSANYDVFSASPAEVALFKLPKLAPNAHISEPGSLDPVTLAAVKSEWRR